MIAPVRQWLARHLAARIREADGPLAREGQATLAFIEAIVPVLLSVGILKRAGPASIPEWIYRMYYILVLVVVILLPTTPDAPAFYFPAILALAAAWLLTAPQLAQAILATNWAPLLPREGAWKAYIVALRRHRLGLPDDLTTDQMNAMADDLVPRIIEVFWPGTLMTALLWLAYRAAGLAVLGLLGMLVGPSLARTHWWRGWSPIALLYGISAPLALMLVLTFIAPVLLLFAVTMFETDHKSKALDDEMRGGGGGSPQTPGADLP